MEYYYYDSETGEFMGTSITIKPGSYTTVAPPLCDHGDEYPAFVEKAVFNALTETWTKVAIQENIMPTRSRGTKKAKDMKKKKKSNGSKRKRG